MQVLFETDDLATALWAELIAVLLRYKRRFPPYFKDKWEKQKDGTWKKTAAKGTGGFVRGACLVKPTLGQAELNFIQAALPLLDAGNVMCKPRPAAKCITKELVDEVRVKLCEGIKDFPDCVNNHLANVCFKCGAAGHVSRFCPKIYGDCINWGVPDMLEGQEEREAKHFKALEKQRKEKEKQTMQTKEKKEKKEKKKVTEGRWSSFTS